MVQALIGGMSIWHWLIVLVVVLLLFGRGKIPELMGDMAKGIRSFKSGIKEDEGEQVRTLENKSEQVAAPEKAKDAKPTS